ncbi:MAG: SIR2 family NAD-dependent protein deacylase [Cellvibrionaceae bacterium]
MKITGYKNIVILTGAGISAASGLKTYRGPGGLWNEHDINEYGHIDRLKDDPSKIWALFGPLRQSIIQAKPNAAHYALSKLEKNLEPDQSLHLITQNVDGLHTAAGNTNVIEFHGNIQKTRCSNTECAFEPFDDQQSYEQQQPSCPLCGSPLVPNIVLFGEQIPAFESWSAKKTLRECDLFLAIGTSGNVSPASQFVRSAQYAGAKTMYINIESVADDQSLFDEEIIGYAETVLPDLCLFG